MLVTDCRTGVKDETSLCHDRTLPGLLSDPLGIVIEEYEALPGGIEYAITGQESFPGSFTAQQFADWVTPRSAESLAIYQPWHMLSFAAATRNRFGSGWGYYVGAIIKEPAFYDGLVVDVLQKAGLQPPVVSPPPGVEASLRQGEGRQLLFLINHTEQEQTVQVPEGKLDLLSGEQTWGTLHLERFGIAVLKLA